MSDFPSVTAALCSKFLVSGRYRIKQPRQFSMRLCSVCFLQFVSCQEVLTVSLQVLIGFSEQALGPSPGHVQRNTATLVTLR